MYVHLSSLRKRSFDTQGPISTGREGQVENKYFVTRAFLEKKVKKIQLWDKLITG
jgi:hypothetical protein